MTSNPDPETTAAPMPAAVAMVRRTLCEHARCEHEIAYDDPCAACPAGHWGAYRLDDCRASAFSTPFEPVPTASAPAPATPQPWPLALSPLKLFARDGDRGLGDVVARTVGPVGGDAFKAWYQRAFGAACGCTERQAYLNRQFPL